MSIYIGKQVIRDGCLILFIVFMAGFEGIAQDKGLMVLSPPKYKEVTIPNTELRTIRSQIVDQEFSIFVQLPPNYVADSTTIYPVLYAMDANRSFPMVANISSVLTFPKGNLPEIIVVGIGYPIKDMSEWAAWRTRI